MLFSNLKPYCNHKVADRSDTSSGTLRRLFYASNPDVVSVWSPGRRCISAELLPSPHHRTRDCSQHWVEHICGNRITIWEECFKRVALTEKGYIWAKIKGPKPGVKIPDKVWRPCHHFGQQIHQRVAEVGSHGLLGTWLASSGWTRLRHKVDKVGIIPASLFWLFEMSTV